MSLMAGFDVILECSNATVVRLLEASFQIGSGTANPPFDVDLGTLHLIVTDIQVDLRAGDRVGIIIGFSNSSVTSPVMISPLDGSFTVSVKIANPVHGRPFLELSQVTTNDITLSLSETSKGVVEKAAVPLGFFTALATGAVKSFISMQPAVPLLPATVAIVPGVDGGFLQSSVQLAAVEAHCIANADRARQSLAFCGVLLAANDGHGDFSAKTESAIAPEDDVCTSISPAAFHASIVCPALREALLGPTGKTSDLPPQCGTSPGLTNSNTNGLTVTSLSDSLGEGHIDFDLAATQEPASGVHVAVTVHGEIVLTPDTGKISATLNLPTDPSVDVSLDGWVWALAVLGGGPIGLAAAGIGKDAAKKTGDGLAKGFKNGTSLRRWKV